MTNPSNGDGLIPEKSQPHTADLGTRYRYRLEGAKLERERIIELIEETLLIHTDQKFFLIRAIKGEQK